MKYLMKSLAICAISVAGSAFAEGDLSRANVIDVVFEMGSTDDGGMYFKPNHLDLETGQAYKLILRNVDDIKHEVESYGMFEKIYTRKVEVVAENGDLIAEIKGGIREVEVGPHAEAEWFIVPIQTGADMEVVCALPGHKEAGMYGTVTIN